MNNPPGIVIQQLNKRFPASDSPALTNLQGEIRSGAVTGLVGPDGAGKTTLLRILAGLLCADSGQVRVMGLDPIADRHALRPQLGYMPQKFGLYEDLSVQENLTLYARLRGLTGQARQQTFQRLLDFTSLAPFTHRLAGKLSGGMKQKLGLACTLVGQPRILLLDEPGVGVDPLSRRELWRMVNSLADEGMLILWSTAYLDEAEQCREIWLLNNGQRLYQGDPAVLTRQLTGRCLLAHSPHYSNRQLLQRLLPLAQISDATIQGHAVRLILAAPARPNAGPCKSTHRTAVNAPSTNHISTSNAPTGTPAIHHTPINHSSTNYTPTNHTTNNASTHSAIDALSTPRAPFNHTPTGTAAIHRTSTNYTSTNHSSTNSASTHSAIDALSTPRAPFNNAPTGNLSIHHTPTNPPVPVTALADSDFPAAHLATPSPQHPPPQDPPSQDPSRQNPSSNTPPPDLTSLSQLLPDARLQITLTPPRFEDAFIDLLGGGVKPDRAASALLAPLPVQPDQSVIIARDLSKTFGQFTATDKVSFQVKRGEIFGLLGPNGAGKSTTFKMMCGLLAPSGGEAQVLGISLKHRAAKVRYRIGYMAQKFSLYGNLTVGQNLRFFSGIYGLRGKIQQAKIRDMVNAFGLQSRLNQPADAQPPGYRQRLALACALMHQPEILFLDEPTSGVDPLTRREFWLHINQLVDKGVTVMVTTHFMDEAEYCDRIGLIYQGQLIASGTPDALKRQAAAIAATQAANKAAAPDKTALNKTAAVPETAVLNETAALNETAVLNETTMEQAFIQLIEQWDKEHPS